jgi:hypothetical protein
MRTPRTASVPSQRPLWKICIRLRVSNGWLKSFKITWSWWMSAGDLTSSCGRRKLSWAWPALLCLPPRQQVSCTIIMLVPMQSHMFIGIIIKLFNMYMRPIRMLMSTVCIRLMLILSTNMRKDGHLLALPLRTRARAPSTTTIIITMRSESPLRSSKATKPMMSRVPREELPL